MAEDKKNEVIKREENPPDKDISLRKDIYEKARNLVVSSSDKFVVYLYKNDYYAGILKLFSQIKTDKGTYTLHLDLLKRQEEGKDVVEELIIQDSDGNKIYRLDINAGPETEAEHKRLQEDPKINKLYKEMGEKGEIWKKIILDRFIDINGLKTTFDSHYAETVITDEEALKIISLISKMEIPPRMVHLPTLKDFLEKNKKAKEDFKLLS